MFQFSIYIYTKFLNGKVIGYNLIDLFEYIIYCFSKGNISKNIEPLNILNYEIVVISLPMRTDRRNHIRMVFSEKNIPYVFFDAIHGKSEFGKIIKEYDISKASAEYLSKGSIGCIISHYRSWERLLSSNNDIMLVFEDDVVIHFEYETLVNILSLIPQDCDILYFGSRKWMSTGSEKGNIIEIFKPFSIRRGAFGYLITKKGAQKLINQIFPIRIARGGVDTILGVLTMKRQLNAYHLSPSICGVDLSFESNIVNSSLKHKLIHRSEL